MPQCKAKFCTVLKGKGISTFTIPDPKKNRPLCEQWIHNLGIENLDIKTFVYSTNNIVCAKHFEEDCFKVDLQAKLLGYKPRCRHLKPDAVPTIFEDTKPVKRRKTSEERIERKTRQQLLTDLLAENDSEKTNEEQLTFDKAPATSSNDQRLNHNKKSSILRKQRKRKIEEPVCNTRDIGIQVSFDTHDKYSSCYIPLDNSNTISCSNCYAREHPGIAITDHVYYNKSSTCTKANVRSSDKKEIGENPCSSAESSNTILADENSDSDEHSDFKTPTKGYRYDPTYEPSPSSDYSPETLHTSREEDKLHVSDTKYIVFFSCLKMLFAQLHCITWDSPVAADDMHFYTEGTCLTVTFTCMRGHEFKWKSQPMLGQQPAGNVLVTAAICLTGNTFTKMESFSDTLKLLFIGKKTFHKIENDYVIPSIHKMWMQQKDILTNTLKSYPLVVSGDGRCDSPGYNAKYCTYTIMESRTSAIIGFNLVQVTEANNSSSKMELVGFQRTMEELKTDGIEISTIATDRHVQIRKYLKDEYPNVNHQFDVCHLAKNVRKKLIAVANKKENSELMPWIKSISNHLWFCASQCNGDSDCLVEMWKSIIWHIQNVHEFEGDKFRTCEHQPLAEEEMQKKKWLKNGSKALRALENIVCDKRLLNDIKHLNLFCHTGSLETYDA